MSPSFNVIKFDQYESELPDDDLMLFAAPAKAIWAWAGIPRKGWNVRMLFQRWITDKRKQEVTAFWNQAAQEREDQAKRFVLGPTALTIAIAGDTELDDGKIVLEYKPPFGITDGVSTKLQLTATIVVDRMRPRLTEEEAAILAQVEADPTAELPDFAHNWVLESLAQIAQAAADPDFFVDHYGLEASDQADLVQSLEALCRPALVVDGQHRLYGAAHADAQIWLPAVAIPNSPWMEGIFQFIVINEKAQRVDTPLLTDIFGSSLTPAEQQAIRLQLDRSGAQVEQRIAAVIAARDPESPFHGMVKFTLEGTSEGFVPELTIRQLIDGGGRMAKAWRGDDGFYDSYVAPTIPVRADWDSWTDGAWRRYWLAFWTEVGSFYNEKAGEDLWSRDGQSNLTKAVTLRLLQRLFMVKSIEAVEDVERTHQTLLEVLEDEELADQKIAEKIAQAALPDTLEAFRQRVRSWFLEKGVPVRVFTKPWVTSLDDAQGQQALWEELEKAFTAGQKGTRYRAQNKDIFEVADA